ncbi:MAG TPA: transposase zinc-binding domain-containing protein [Rhizobiaceae bacterium]|nr:transposase zinc-binding domain-containing protein [Rhizobiaceae bacterium]
MNHLPTPCALPLGDSAWQRRRPERSVLYRVIQDEVETFLARRNGIATAGLPHFIRREFLAFLDCGIPARGFLRLRCEGCHREQILPFSCKGRGFCPSCCHRRMLDHEIHITGTVLPDLPIRQFVFTFPFALRYRIAFDPILCADVRRILMRALFAFYRQRAEEKNLPAGPTGAIAVT